MTALPKWWNASSGKKQNKENPECLAFRVFVCAYVRIVDG